jgi:hypothetical protein
VPRPGGLNRGFWLAGRCFSFSQKVHLLKGGAGAYYSLPNPRCSVQLAHDDKRPTANYSGHMNTDHLSQLDPLTPKQHNLIAANEPAGQGRVVSSILPHWPDDVPARMDATAAVDLRATELQRVVSEQICVIEINSQEALRRRVEDVLIEVDRMLHAAIEEKDPQWWRFADLRDDVVDVLRAV